MRGPATLGMLLCLGIAGACGGGDVLLCQSLTESAANQVMLELGRQGIVAHKRSGGRRAASSVEVHVGAADVTRALAVLAAAGLPPAAEAPQAEGWLPNAAADEARQLASTVEALQRSLALLEDVRVARVHVAAAPPEATLTAGAPSPLAPTAAVLLKYRRAPRRDDTATAQTLVAGAIAGLRPQDVQVVRLMPAAEAPQARALSPASVPLGPFRVAPQSAVPMRWLLVSALLLQAALAAAVVVLWRRRDVHKDPA